MREQRQSRIIAYAAAVALTAAAVFLRWLTDPWLGNSVPFVTLFGAVAVAVWLWGYGSALLVAGLGYLACDYLFTEPRGTFAVYQSQDYIGLILYAFTCYIIISLGQGMRIARLHADVARQAALDGQKQLEQGLARRRQAEDELRRAEERARSVVDNVVDGIITIDEHGIVESFNPAAERLFGHSASEVIGRNVKMLMPEPYHHEHDGYIAGYLRTGEAKIIGIGRQVVGLRKDGSTFPMDLAVSEFLAGSGRRFTGIVRDVTERSRTEEFLRESEQQLRLALEAGRMGTWQWKLQTNEVIWSTGLENIHGLAPGTFDGTFAAYQKDIHPEDREHVLRSIAQTVERGEDHHVEYRIIWADGSVHWVEGRGKLFRNHAGVPTRMVGVCTDITERKRAEEALKEVDRRKDVFLAMLSHELRNPLAPIRNAVQIQKAKGAQAPELVWTRDVIDRQVRHLARMVDDLLDVSRISANKLQVRKEPVDLTSIIESAVETSRPLIEAAAHRLTVTLPSEPIHLEGDPIRLAQVLSNLLNNAAKYTPKGGAISLEAKREGSDAILSVVDNGIGIRADVLPRVFDVFSQATAAPEGSQSGLGVGLSLAKALVELHGGSIGARSKGLNQGSEFIIRLPLITAQKPSRGRADTLSGEDAAQKTAARHRILVADDLHDAADSLAILLRFAGHEVRTAYNGEEALETVGTFRPHAALLDIGMDRMNGYDVCRRIREQPWGKTMFLVALTGWGQEKDRRHAEEAGFNEHMVKPIDPAALMELLAGVERTKA